MTISPLRGIIYAVRLYQSQVVCRVCGITPRRLDYWVTSGVIDPARSYHPRSGGRILFLFTFEDMVKVRLIQSLRSAGVSLQTVRHALEELKQSRGRAWQSEWLLTDGKRVLKATDNAQVLESLAKREKGQLVFSLIALQDAKSEVQSTIEAKHYQPFAVARVSARRGGVVRAFAR